MSKTRASIALLTASSFLALSAIGPADAAKKKPSCKSKEEEKGCKLKSGASYSGTLSGGGSVGLSVDKKEWSVSVFPNATGADPCRGRTTDSTSIDFQGRPKVGKTYTVKETGHLDSRSDLHETKTVDGKVTISSAKKAKFSGTYFREGTFRNDPPSICQRSLKVTAKRK